MARSRGQGQLLWVAGIALALCGALLGLRSERAVSSVLAGTGVEILMAGAQPGVIPDLERLATKDSLLAAVVPAARDPFSDPAPPPRPTRKTAPATPQPAVDLPPPQPRLQALLFDLVDPAIQLRVGGETSGWLPVGGEHGGWRILEITSGSAVVSHAHGDTLTLL